MFLGIFPQVMVGREKEKEVFNKALKSNKPELIAVIGRRRVGKTFLIRNFFKGKIDFELVGLKEGTKAQQLRNFSFSLLASAKQKPSETPTDWLDAFHQLGVFLEHQPTKEKQVLFFDELPWLASARSGFMTGFNYFWNSYVSKKNIVVVICGSAASWMIKHIINDKGGLHNRVTRSIFLKPFTLHETQAYFFARKINFDPYQIVLLYMVLGGIPYYLDHVQKGESAVQNINNICFKQNGFLRNEFENLYQALFKHPERHESVVKALSSKWKGLSRNEIVDQISLKDGGGITTVLKELEQSGFIESYAPFNKKKKDKLFRLTDYYSLFYLKFIQGSPNNDDYWNVLSQTQSWKSWSGYVFENVCIQHVDAIKKVLGIVGIYSNNYSFIAKPKDNNSGAQIDLLIDRNDQTINLCEIKFYNETVEINAQMAKNIQNKRSVFRKATQTKKQIFITLISTYGLTSNQYSIGLVDNEIKLDDLFLV